jgi:hypothetical protein
MVCSWTALLYSSFLSSPKVIRAIKQRKMRWAGHEACMDRVRNEYGILI